jgi:transcriptional regulator with XRE-family HTH domain
MQTHEKLKTMRQCKGWTQEETAEKLNWAINSYRKIEQGKASIKLEKLQQIAKVMGVDVEELVNSDEKTVLNFAENCTQHHFQNTLEHCTILLTEAQCAHELEKAHLQLELKDKELAMQQREIENLKVQITQLQDIVTLLKDKTSQ